MHFLTEVAIAVTSGLTAITLAALRYAKGVNDADLREVELEDARERRFEAAWRAGETERARAEKRALEARAAEEKKRHVEAVVQRYLASLPAYQKEQCVCPACRRKSAIFKGKGDILDFDQARSGYGVWTTLMEQVASDGGMDIPTLLDGLSREKVRGFGPTTPAAVELCAGESSMHILWQICVSCGTSWLVHPKRES